MADQYPSVRINFGGTKRYRQFPFLPRVGDRINTTDPDGAMTYALDVDAVWFDDNYGDSRCEVILNCSMAEESKLGKMQEG